MSRKNSALILRGDDIFLKDDEGILSKVELTREKFYEEVARQKQKPKLVGKTVGQQDYLETINQSIITICTGPAGCGKTWMSTVRALELFQEGKYKRIVFTRPAAECGENLGFLPGEIDEKFAPYALPIVDILTEFISHKQIKDYISTDMMRFTPLAYLRGHSIRDSIVILDEAQNATAAQLLMFITRIGECSKLMINGDEKQTDKSDSGYVNFVRDLEAEPYIDGVNVVRLGEADIVRNPLIRKILAKLGE